MVRELFLLRHGKSDWRLNVADFDRPLKKRGKLGAQRIGAWLHGQQIVPDLIISSPAERAINTAEKCCKAAGLTAGDVAVDRRLYLANSRTLLAVLAEVAELHQDKRRVMLVGHNPGLEALLIHLSRDRLKMPADGKLMPTATIARLRMPDDWSVLKKGSAQVMALVRASTLPEKFPFPGVDGVEQRKRPAYYYTQSAVIPYRVKDGQTEIMLIGSSGKKHWSVPKGIADPGLSLAASASKEAWEEAGVTGEVMQQPIGVYEVEKWGGKCQVTVFVMRVENEMPAAQWQESHRGRQWVNIAKACALLKHNELKAMVRLLDKGRA